MDQPTDQPKEISLDVQRWMKQGYHRAQFMVTMGAKYHPIISQLLFFYCRAMLSIHCKRAKTAKAMGISYFNRLFTQPPPVGDVSPEAIAAAEDWAICLAKAGATYREALYVFKLSLFNYAIDYAKQNRGLAARILGLHRNTLWRKDVGTPENIQLSKRTKTRKAK